MAADCRGDKDIEKQFRRQKCSWQYAGQEVLICTCEGKKFNSFHPIYGFALWRYSYQNSIRKLTVS